jgi:uncharacterized protein YbjT (DUF2867 family)
MCILVAGASGGIGNAVVDTALTFGYEVYAISRSPIRQQVWRKIQIDIFNTVAVMTAMDSGIDAVISCIGMQRFGVPRIIAVSAAGVANSAEELNMVGDEGHAHNNHDWYRLRRFEPHGTCIGEQWS